MLTYADVCWFCTSLLALLVLNLLVLEYIYDKRNENMCYDGAE